MTEQPAWWLARLDNTVSESFAVLALEKQAADRREAGSNPDWLPTAGRTLPASEPASLAMARLIKSARRLQEA